MKEPLIKEHQTMLKNIALELCGWRDDRRGCGDSDNGHADCINCDIVRSLGYSARSADWFMSWTLGLIGI